MDPVNPVRFSQVPSCYILNVSTFHFGKYSSHKLPPKGAQDAHLSARRCRCLFSRQLPRQYTQRMLLQEVPIFCWVRFGNFVENLCCNTGEICNFGSIRSIKQILQIQWLFRDGLYNHDCSRKKTIVARGAPWQVVRRGFEGLFDFLYLPCPDSRTVQGGNCEV